MSLVYAGVCCHAPGITGRTEMADPELVEGLHSAFDRQRKAIEQSGTEAIVLVSSEHFANFFMDNMPTFTMGIAEEYEGPIENPDWLGIGYNKVPANVDLSLSLLREVMQTVDVGYAQEWKFDHGTSVPLHFLTPDYHTPIIPVNINCQHPPFSPLHRNWELGKALRRAIDKVPDKIALIGTGGTSHWPCTPDSGKINEEWDRRFIAQVVAKDKNKLLSYNDEQTRIDAGQGAGEMRTSICIAAATQDQKGEVWYLEPIPIFATSCLIATLFQ
ncbi:MAG: extradiol ring-cleavage dioxygenase [Pseudomonadota bacterium]|nr:extradiol ring-cleavage dioxygenase [Pseudomonadota bacterium]